MSDAVKRVTNPDLVRAIQRAREDSTAAAWAEMVREAARSRFITPIDLPPPAGPGEAPKAGFSLHMLEDPESGRRFYMAFTDWDELGKWRKAEGQRVLVVTFDDCARLVLDGKLASGGFIINPFGGNVVFDRQMIEAVRREKRGRGPEEVVMEKGTTVCLGEPGEYPGALVRAISDYLATQPGVRAAYLQQMEADGAPSYLVAVDFEGDEKALFQGISGAAQGLLSDLPLSLASCGAEFWRGAAAGLDPFYTKP